MTLAERIVSMHRNQRLTGAEIARQLKCSKVRVHQVLKDHGIGQGGPYTPRTAALKPLAPGAWLHDPTMPTEERDEAHVAACLAEGGFPTATHQGWVDLHGQPWMRRVA